MANKDVLIVGAGVAGLACAGFLRQHGIEPELVERLENWDQTGYGLGLWGNGRRILERLGIGEAVRANGTPLREFHVRKAGGEVLTTEQLGSGDEAPFLAIHRGDLHAAMRQLVPDDRITMATTPESIDQTEDRVEVTFDGGREATYDLVVGADGIHSEIRDRCFEDWDLIDCQTVAWSFWAPEAAEVPDATTDIWAPGTEAYVTHVDGRGLINIATTAPTDRSVDPPARGLLAETADQLGWLFPEIVDGLDEEADVFCDLNQKVRVGTWTNGRIGLMGDAAHALHPISGQGASMALEDAWVLGDEFPRWQRGEVTAEEMLTAYVDRRRDRVEQFQRQTAWLESTTFTASRLFGGFRNLVAKYTPVFEWFMQRQTRDLTENLFERL